MDTPSLQAILELAKREFKCESLTCDLALEFCERGLLGGVKGKDYLVVTHGSHVCRLDIAAPKQVLSSFSANTAMFRTNAVAGFGYDPKGVIAEIGQKVQVRETLESWIPQADRAPISGVLKRLIMANCASALGLTSLAILDQFNKRAKEREKQEAEKRRQRDAKLADQKKRDRLTELLALLEHPEEGDKTGIDAVKEIGATDPRYSETAVPRLREIAERYGDNTELGRAAQSAIATIEQAIAARKRSERVDMTIGCGCGILLLAGVGALAYFVLSWLF